LCQTVHPQHGGNEVLLGRKTSAKSIATATQATARGIQGDLPECKDLTCLAREVLNTAANNITRQIS
jgi:hypothetical protein